MSRVQGDYMFRHEWLKDNKFTSWVASDSTDSISTQSDIIIN